LLERIYVVFRDCYWQLVYLETIYMISLQASVGVRIVSGIQCSIQHKQIFKTK